MFANIFYSMTGFNICFLRILPEPFLLYFLLELKRNCLILFPWLFDFLRLIPTCILSTVVNSLSSPFFHKNCQRSILFQVFFIPRILWNLFFCFIFTSLLNSPIYVFASLFSFKSLYMSPVDTLNPSFANYTIWVIHSEWLFLLIHISPICTFSVFAAY